MRVDVLLPQLHRRKDRVIIALQNLTYHQAPLLHLVLSQLHPLQRLYFGGLQRVPLRQGDDDLDFRLLLLVNRDDLLLVLLSIDIESLLSPVQQALLYNFYLPLVDGLADQHHQLIQQLSLPQRALLRVPLFEEALLHDYELVEGNHDQLQKLRLIILDCQQI